MSRGQIRTELCKVIPQAPIGLGCGNCSAKLLMCPKKSFCWRSAMNLTYQKDANTSAKKLYPAYRRMAADPNCADLLEDALTPMDMLVGIKKRAAGSTPEELRPTAECKKFHCAVMINTIMEADLNGKNITCPNKYKTKFPSQAYPPKESVMTACPCRTELRPLLKFSTANQMIGICSEWASNKKTAILNFVIDSIIASKDGCFKPNIEEWKLANAAAMKAILNSPQGNNCLSLLSTAKGAAQTITTWYGKTHTMIASGGQTFMRYDADKYKLPPQCGPMVCSIFKSALADTKRCFWNNNTNLNMTSSDDITKIVTMCAKALMTIDPDVVTKDLCMRRKVEGKFKKLNCTIPDGTEYKPWTTTPPPTTPPPPPATTPPARLLSNPEALAGTDEEELPEFNYEDPRTNIHSAYNDSEQLEGPRMLSEARHGLHDLGSDDDETQYDPFAGVQYSSGFSEEEEHSSELQDLDSSWDPFGEMEGEEERMLGATTTAAAGGGGSSSSGGSSAPELPPYKVDVWTKCSCIQQCVWGVKTRDVTCEAKACMEPEPPSKESCLCMHCADCVVDMNLMIISFTFLLQGVIALLVCASFAHFGSKDEDDLASLNICEKCLGCVCKCLPLYVRVLTILSFFQLIFICLQCFVPTAILAISTDCNQVPILKDTAMITSMVWALQLAMGLSAKRLMAVPAWLYAPMRPGKGCRYQCKKALRALGP